VTPRSDLTIRRALPAEADDIARLNNFFAEQALMLRRTPEMISLAIDDYVVAVDDHSTVVGCGALKEYSPSIAEVAAIAVSPTAQGLGLGSRIVTAVEELARKRGIPEVFALTLQPPFFEKLGYQRVDRARYPEKIRRDCIGCSRRFACNETCFAKPLRDVASARDARWEAAA
jgi:N-acetylglutamate synthase-like GNAT family acetyltransferase